MDRKNKLSTREPHSISEKPLTEVKRSGVVVYTQWSWIIGKLRSLEANPADSVINTEREFIWLLNPI